MQQKTKEKIVNLVSRSFRSLPVAQDLPRLLQFIAVYDQQNNKLYPPLNADQLHSAELLRCLLVEIAKNIGDADDRTLLERTFEPHFRLIDQNYSQLRSSLASSGSSSPRTPRASEGVDSLQDEKLKEALRYLPKAFNASSGSSGQEKTTFHVQLDKPASHVFISIDPSADLQIKVPPPSDVQKTPSDCKIMCSTSEFTSIIVGTATPLEALQAGRMIVDNMAKLAIFGKSFTFDRKKFDVYKAQLGPSEAGAPLDAVSKIPISTSVGKYFDEVLGENNILTKVVKVLNSATISPAIIELKFALGTEYMTKDVPNSWRYDVVIGRDVVEVKSRKSEQHIKQYFNYTWDLELKFNGKMECVEAEISVAEITFGECDPQHKENIKKVLSVYLPKRGTISEKNEDPISSETTKSDSRIEKYSSGDVYEGEFDADGLRHGSGVYTTASGDQYVGQFRKGLRDGHGVYTTKEGSRYEGDFKNGKPHGKGVYVFENGDVYSGDFQDEDFQGRGNWSSEDGSSYVGEFERGKRSGYGIMFSKGATYDGEWKEGVFYGKGIYVYSTGDLYEGDFVKGKFEGYGRYTTSGGVVIEGRFAQGKPVDVPVETKKVTSPQFDPKDQKAKFEKWREDNLKKIEARKKIRQMIQTNK
eukprot:TRINITY_DN6731_c0_g1_i1.p1 TRINITY_DN6731_c0_g1~~TRINITY_DN6731_c0_g1_i1.p1  ORF type:complete len:643 (-),score=182.41 TRINITY_DN6731_c0_g1_i1:465-2393(-)